MTTPRHQTLYLLDAYNLLFRSFSSLPESILGPDQRAVNAVYGVISTLLRMCRDDESARFVAAFDVPDVPTFRHHLYPDYQGQRGPLGDENSSEFVRQVTLARHLLPLLRVPVLLCPGYEADDIMGTCSVRAARSGIPCAVVSTDRDVLQLVAEGVIVVVPGKEATVIADDDGVRNRIGVAAGGVPTFKALAGDASDNIPGVRGIGAKTAAALVDRYGSLSEIYAHLGDLPARTRSLLEAGERDAYLFLQLVTIVTDLDITMDVEQVPVPDFSGTDRVRSVLEKAWEGL